MTSYELIEGRMVPTDDTCSHVGPLWLPQDYPDADKLRAEVSRSSQLNGPTGRLLYFDDPYTSIYKFFWTCPTCEGIRGIWVAALFRGPLDPPGPHPCARCDHWTTRDGIELRWHEIGDSHLKYIARHLERRIINIQRVLLRHTAVPAPRHLSSPALHGRKSSTRFTAKICARAREKQSGMLSFALTEAAYRGMVPTLDELRVAWDLACSEGRQVTTDEYDVTRPLTLIELWVEFVPRLWGSHAPPWTRLAHRKVA